MNRLFLGALISSVVIPAVKPVSANLKLGKQSAMCHINAGNTTQKMIAN